MNVTAREGKVFLSWMIESEPGPVTGKTTQSQFSVEIPVEEADQLLHGRLKAAIIECQQWNFRQAEAKKKELKHEYQKLTNRSILR